MSGLEASTTTNTQTNDSVGMAAPAVEPAVQPKPKRPMSEKQLAALKRGRENMRLKREAAKAAKAESGISGTMEAQPANSGAETDKPPRKRSRKNQRNPILMTNGKPIFFQAKRIN